MTPVLVALDFSDPDRAQSVASTLRPHVGGFKVGLELIMASGPSVISEIAALGLPVFADVKLHDIPNTVRGAAHRIGSHGARWLTLHASGGAAMIEAGIEGMAQSGREGANGVLAVTVLTSLERHDLAAIGIGGEVAEVAGSLAELAALSGAEGVVCSPLDLPVIVDVAPSLLRVTPGIRTEGVESHDQKRFTSPTSALAAGADWLVIGRAITGAEDPVRAAEEISASLSAIS